MNHDVKAKQVNESLVFTESKDMGKVPGVVFRLVNGGWLTLAVDVVVDATGNSG